jgi:hypothetical protein
LRKSFSSEIEMSPVIDVADELDARQAPSSCALAATPQASNNPKTTHTIFSRVIS